MKSLFALALFAAAATASLSFFKYQRPVVASGTGQHYLVVDETLWAHARPDLGDLRFYAGQTEIPYTLVIERGSVEHDRQDVPVFQQASVGGKTQFLIDMSGLAEYDHVNLKLTAKNFVAHAKTEGQDDLHGQNWAGLGDDILYDLSKENLGSNTMLRLPRSTYKYLRVTIDGPVKTAEVTGAASEVRLEQQALWRTVSSDYKAGEAAAKITPSNSQFLPSPPPAKASFLTFSVSDHVPIEHAVFEIDPAQPNFRRGVTIQDEEGRVVGTGEINRIHMVRAGRKIDSEQQKVEFFSAARESAPGAKKQPRRIIIVISNGDDPPLMITGARLEQNERRIYFDAGASPLMLYYGDEKLSSPVYDYAKLFQEQKDAALAQLGAETANANYTERPDERPWSDRHPAVLWIAIVAAVLALGALALKSMKTASAQ